jgi:PAS domain S-box-containing protein
MRNEHEAEAGVGGHGGEQFFHCAEPASRRADHYDRNSPGRRRLAVGFRCARGLAGEGFPAGASAAAFAADFALLFRRALAPDDVSATASVGAFRSSLEGISARLRAAAAAWWNPPPSSGSGRHPASLFEDASLADIGKKDSGYGRSAPAEPAACNMATELSDDQLKAFLDASPDAMVIVDEGGTIVFVNIETEAMFEYSRAELIGQPVELLLPERFRNRHASHVSGYSLAPRRRPMGAGLELYARRKDGTEFPVEISLSPVATAQGRFVSSAIRNVADQKAIERRLIEARELAEHANRAKSAFLAAASHDLRQPLQTLSLLTSALGRFVPSDSKAATAVANQSDALRSMAGC